MWQCEPQPKARRVYECGSASRSRRRGESMNEESPMDPHQRARLLSVLEAEGLDALVADRKSTRLNSSHTVISYAVFCLKKKRGTPPSLRGRSGVAPRLRCRLAV